MGEMDKEGDTPIDQVTQESAEALGKAMQGLSVKQAATQNAGVLPSSRVNAADITLIMEEMEVSKAKASDVLRGCGGNATEALRRLLHPY
jgi:NACalpha-BTF3-like transcription factor